MRKRLGISVFFKKRHTRKSTGRGEEMLQGADDAEAAEAWGSSVRERIWGPVCGEHTHAIGAPAPVASVLLRPTGHVNLF